MTTAASTGRVRRRVRFAPLDQEGARLREIDPGRQRMTVSDRLEFRSFQNTQDWTSGMGISPSGQFRVIEEPVKKPKLFSRNGIYSPLARGILFLMAAAAAVMLLVGMAEIGASRLQIQRMNTRIASVEQKNEELRLKLAISGGDLSVCTEAVKLNMIGSGGAQTIELTAPAARLILGAGREDPETRALAAFSGEIQGD